MRDSDRSFVCASLAAGLALVWAAAGHAPAWAQSPAEAGDGKSEPAAAEPSSPITGWFRLDLDSLGPQLWFGATHKLGGVAVASDIYVTGTFAELDLGVTLTFGNLSLTPMAGIGFDFATYDVASIIAPQLFTTYIQGPIYFDSWIQVFFTSPFVDGARDLVYVRAFVVYKLTELFAIGPQVETSFYLNETMDGAGDDGLGALPVGAQVNVGYGGNSTLGIFLGYETQYEGDGAGITGRFTFVRTW